MSVTNVIYHKDRICSGSLLTCLLLFQELFWATPFNSWKWIATWGVARIPSVHTGKCSGFLFFFFFLILHIFKYIFSFLKKSSFSLCSGLVAYLILGRSSYSMLYILIQFSMWSQMWVEMCWGRAAVRTLCYLVVWVAGCHQLRDSSVLRSTTSAHPSW